MTHTYIWAFEIATMCCFVCVFSSKQKEKFAMKRKAIEVWKKIVFAWKCKLALKSNIFVIFTQCTLSHSNNSWVMIILINLSKFWMEYWVDFYLLSVELDDYHGIAHTHTQLKGLWMALKLIQRIQCIVWIGVDKLLSFSWCGSFGF